MQALRMETIPRNQVVRKIQSILSREHAVKFIENRHYLMMYADGQHSAMARKRLDAAYNGDKGLIAKMIGVFNQLASTFAVFDERVSAAKTVSGKKSLLDYLTDGESHLNIYPDVNFH